MDKTSMKRALSNGNLRLLLVDHHEKLNNREYIFTADTFSDDIINRFENSLDSTLIVFHKCNTSVDDIISMYEELENLSDNVDSLEYLNSIGSMVNIHKLLGDMSSKIKDKLTEIIHTYGDIIDYDELHDLLNDLK